MQIKHQLGKLSLSRPLPDLVQSQQRANNIQLLPVKPAHVYALTELPPHHKDPFDRLLVAQARSESLVLVSMETLIKQYDNSILG